MVRRRLLARGEYREETVEEAVENPVKRALSGGDDKERSTADPRISISPSDDKSDISLVSPHLSLVHPHARRIVYSLPPLRTKQQASQRQDAASRGLRRPGERRTPESAAPRRLRRPGDCGLLRAADYAFSRRPRVKKILIVVSVNVLD